MCIKIRQNMKKQMNVSGYVEMEKRALALSIASGCANSIYTDRLIFQCMSKLISEEVFMNEVINLGRKLINQGYLNIEFSKTDHQCEALIAFECNAEAYPKFQKYPTGIRLEEIMTEEEIMKLINEVNNT